MKISICSWGSIYLELLMNYAKQTGGIAEEISDSHDSMKPPLALHDDDCRHMVLTVDFGNCSSPERILGVVHQLWERCERDNRFRSWKFNRDKITLNLKEIYCFEAYHRKVTVYSYHGKFRIKTTIPIEAQVLEHQGFIRVHHGFLVQIDQISQLGPQELILTNGQVVPISRRYKKSLFHRLQERPSLINI